MKYARVQDGHVREVIDLPDGVTPADRYTSGVAATFYSLELPGGSYVEDRGYLFDGSKFTADSTPEEKFEALPYGEKRKGAYKPLEDQLDMQYHDQLNGTTTWKDHVNEIKARYPKP